MSPPPPCALRQESAPPAAPKAGAPASWRSRALPGSAPPPESPGLRRRGRPSERLDETEELHSKIHAASLVSVPPINSLSEATESARRQAARGKQEHDRNRAHSPDQFLT